MRRRYEEMLDQLDRSAARTKLQRNVEQLKRRYEEMREQLDRSAARAKLQKNIEQLRRRYEGMREQFDSSAARAKLQENIESMKRRYDEMREQLEGSRARASEKVGRMASRMPLVGIRTGTREHINAYWRQTWERFRRGSLLRINPFKVSFYFLRDVKLCVWFNVAFLLAYTR
jgi:predicted  nucleic acid-binding Zn-ribbon protein